MKVAVAVCDLAPSQLNFLVIKNGNDWLAENPRDDYLVLYQRLAAACMPMNFASMQIIEGWGLDGVLVATSLSTAENIIKFPSATKKFFYVWDLEWIRQHNTYRYFQDIYGNKELNLISRSKDHAKAIKHAWNRDSIIIEDFNLKEIVKAAS